LLGRLDNIDTIKLLAIGNEDLLRAWSRNNAIRVLALLFDRDVSDKLGAGTYIELRGGNIVSRISEEERYRSILAVQA
jgi:hypothetical protein